MKPSMFAVDFLNNAEGMITVGILIEEDDMIGQYQYGVILKINKVKAILSVCSKLDYSESILHGIKSDELNEITIAQFINDSVTRIERGCSGGCIWNTKLMVIALDHPNIKAQLSNLSLIEHARCNFGCWDLEFYSNSYFGSMTTDELSDHIKLEYKCLTC